MAVRGKCAAIERMRQIGMLMNLAADDPQVPSSHDRFVQRLQQFGWTDGHNIRIDARWGAGDPDRYRTLATELMALAPDVIVVATTSVTGVVRRRRARCPSCSCR